MMGYIYIFIRNQKKLDIECDINENTPSDYTVLMQNIPKFTSMTEASEAIMKFFEELSFTQVNHELHVEKVAAD